MGSRYFITGTQLGLLKLFVEKDVVSIRRDIADMLQEIEDKQFIDNVDEEKHKIIIIREEK